MRGQKNEVKKIREFVCRDVLETSEERIRPAEDVVYQWKTRHACASDAEKGAGHAEN